MLITHQHPHNKSLTIAVIGKPNVGKSTFINKVMGQDYSIVTHKPQTTRNHFQLIAVRDKTEFIFIDTPGIHKSNQEINLRINQQAKEGADGADINLLLVDISKPIFNQIETIKSELPESLGETWILFTKTDLVEGGEELPFSEVFEKIQSFLPSSKAYFKISAKEGRGIEELLEKLDERAPNSPHLYPGGDLSNKNERFFVSEYIREQLFFRLNEELPYETAVLVDSFYDYRDNEESKLAAKIAATILVNRPGQRAIVIGKGGENIKMIGIEARKKIEELVGGKVVLNLHVKVSPKWFKKNLILEDLGLPRATMSHRVWRSR